MSEIPILIVDDNEIDRYLLVRELKACEYTFVIHEKTNGKDAVDFLADYSNNKETHQDHFPPKIIFLDVNMPLMDGFEFLEAFTEIRHQHDLASCVVMMFTTSEREDNIEKAKSYDFVKHYLVKGAFDVAELKDKIREIVKPG